MLRLDDLQLFLRSHALGSFSAAAREAGLLPGQVSAAIARLERELAVRLFARSTRSLRLTAEGEAYLPYARRMLEALEEGGQLLRGAQQELGGTLQIAAPSDLGRNVVLPLLGDLRRRYPSLNLRLLLSDQVSDLFRDPVDVALRYGQLEDSSLVALPLAPRNRRVLVASPDYLARRGRPAQLEALAGHDCLRYLLHGQVYGDWGFCVEGRRISVAVDGPLLCDDADVVRRWALMGEGIAYKSWLDVCADVRAGRLEVLLPQQRGEPVPLYLVCPHRKQFSAAVQRLHGLLGEQLQALCEDLPE